MDRPSFAFSHRLPRLIPLVLFLGAVFSFIVYLCAFKIVDNDFWWHVKSGEMMFRMRGLIGAEPFSYVLASKPYGALHEWFAQIVFFLVYQAGGVTASILLRGLLAAVTVGFLLLIDRRSFVPWAILGVIAVFLHRPSLMVRPQLFTFMLFALVLVLTFRYVAGPREEKKERGETPYGRLYGLSILFIQLLWVNLHGASAIYGVFVIGALFLQGCVDWYRSDDTHAATLMRALRFRGLLLLLCILALFGSPNGFETFADMYLHSFDRTIPLVREWMPLVWRDYRTDVLPFGVLAFIALCLRRRQWALCGALLLITGFLSLQAYRHCFLFVIASLGVTIFQMAEGGAFQRWREKLSAGPFLLPSAGLLILCILFAFIYPHDLRTIMRTNAFGFGVDIPVQYAENFVEKNDIRGTLFNSYNQGGYLLYRGAPGRMVFADGRNIEYGYPFVQKLLDAGVNITRWRELENAYHFTYAVVEYKANESNGSTLPYIVFLSADPSWKLVYVDDWASVYVKDIPQNRAVIQRHAYSLLTPNFLEFADVLDSLPADNIPLAEKELQRAIAGNDRSIKPRMLLATIYSRTGRPDLAEALLREALKAQPYRPELYEQLGLLSVGRQEWYQAGEYFEKAVSLADGGGPQINYDYLAEIFSKAGDPARAEYYHKKFLKTPPASAR